MENESSDEQHDNRYDDVLESLQPQRRWGSSRPVQAARGRWPALRHLGCATALALLLAVAAPGLWRFLEEAYPPRTAAQEQENDQEERGAQRDSTAPEGHRVEPPACRDGTTWKLVEWQRPEAPTVPGAAGIEVQVRARFEGGRLLGLCGWCAVRENPGRTHPAAAVDACTLTRRPPEAGRGRGDTSSRRKPPVAPDARVADAAWTDPIGQVALQTVCGHAWRARAVLTLHDGGTRVISTPGYQVDCPTGA
ncbi:hypothetical protein [Streptomyces boninensis]|uniref:hypothetical protein n=1 Tax=Streptomyces boninensis TaxID=2039455 RepID=UPI003B21FD15